VAERISKLIFIGAGGISNSGPAIMSLGKMPKKKGGEDKKNERDCGLGPRAKVCVDKTPENELLPDRGIWGEKSEEMLRGIKGAGNRSAPSGETFPISSRSRLPG